METRMRMLHKLSLAAAVLMLTASMAQAAVIELQPIPDAFARLGHSCGGIKQQILGTGFDANGNVTGYASWSRVAAGITRPPTRRGWR
jgi:hypothetical protein